VNGTDVITEMAPLISIFCQKIQGTSIPRTTAILYFLQVALVQMRGAIILSTIDQNIIGDISSKIKNQASFSNQYLTVIDYYINPDIGGDVHIWSMKNSPFFNNDPYEAPPGYVIVGSAVAPQTDGPPNTSVLKFFIAPVNDLTNTSLVCCPPGSSYVDFIDCRFDETPAQCPSGSVVTGAKIFSQGDGIVYISVQATPLIWDKTNGGFSLDQSQSNWIIPQSGGENYRINITYNDFHADNHLVIPPEPFLLSSLTWNLRGDLDPPLFNMKVMSQSLNFSTIVGQSLG